MDGNVICEECKKWCGSDVYAYCARILCGDCRYEARHGHRPHYSARRAQEFVGSE